jgi:hypothetical protein
MSPDPEGRSDPEPPGSPGLLRMVPVVLLPEGSILEPVLAGIARAGGGASVRVVSGMDERRAVLERGVSTEVVVATVDRPSEELVGWVTALLDRGARPLPVLRATLAAGVEASSLSMLGELPQGLNVAVPALEDDAARSLVWSTLRRAGVEERHHLVDVDGRPALDELASRGTAVEGDLITLLAAGAAGVLGGRMAAGNRIWRAQLEG